MYRSEGTHIGGVARPPQLLYIGTSDRSIDALHTLDNRSQN
jgi:hypothetical protein